MIHRSVRGGAVALTVLASVAACDSGGALAPPSTVRSSTHTTIGSTSASSPGSTAASKGSSTSPGPTTLPGATSANRQIAALTKYLGSGGVSVAAVRTDDGSTYRYGATGGMATGSIAKLFILETLLLQRQEAGTALSDGDREAATRMIENSDNAAADQLYGEVGTVAGLNKAGKRLGVRNTQPGENYLWGFTETCATDYIALLRDLIAPSALSRTSRLFALDLMSNIESDQQWGVSAAADKDTSFQLKNGWLPSDPDGGRWLVNSVGVVTVHGHQVLLAVMTQHGNSFDGGIDLVEKIAKIAAAVVA